MPAPRAVAVALVSLLVSLAALADAVPPPIAAASVVWPPSRGPVIGEVITGGASASDEYVEIYNAAATAVDLGGDELVYVTASGATTTRKAAFTSPLQLVSGQHLLVANLAGMYAPLADATYSGGLAADGGSLVLRTGDGTVIDTVGWGTAANAYVEGAVAPAPPARSSLERRPGATAGNWTDTNDNASDWFVQPNPVPESMTSAPRPGPTASPPAGPATPIDAATSAPPTQAAEPTAEPTAVPSDATAEPSDATAEPTVEPTSVPTAEPTAHPSDTPTAQPSAEPTAQPTSAPTQPTEPTAPPTQTDLPLEPIATARLQVIGARVHVSGVVTAGSGIVGADNLLAVADSSGGIFVRLAEVPADLAIGCQVELVGALATPYGQLEIREIEWLVAGPAGADPVPDGASLSDVGERLEGSLVTVAGTIDSVSVDSGRLTITLVDGKSQLRALADPLAGISKSDVAKGERVALSGVISQHATALGREDGYRMWLRRREDVALLEGPSPGPTPAPSAAKTPHASATPRSSATPHASATPTPVAVYRDLASGLAARGRSVDVEATVTAATGIIDWGGPTIVVDDGTAAVAVVLPTGSPSPRVGARVRVAGKVGSLYSGPRVVATLVEWLGDGTAPQPLQVAVALSTQHEWRLVQVSGRVERLVRAGSRWRADLSVGGHTVAVLGEPGAGIPAAGLVKGRLAVATGIVRRSTSDSSAFVLLPRSSRDLWLGPAPAAPAGTGGQAAIGQPATLSPGSALPSSEAPLVTISELANHEGSTVTVAGIVVAAAEGAATLDDGTGSARLGGQDGADALALLEPGDAIEVTGQVSRDAEGLLLVVDPDLILTLAGPDLGESASKASAAASGGYPDPAASSAAAENGSAAGPDAEAHGLARPSAGLDESGGIPAPALVGALALLLLLGLLAATMAPGRRRMQASIRRWRRP